MKAVRTSETSVYFSETSRPCITDGSHLQTRRRENQKSRRFKNISRRFWRSACVDRKTQRKVRQWPSSGIQHRVVCRLMTHRHHDGGRKHLWNVGLLLRDYTALYPGRHRSSEVPMKLAATSATDDCYFFYNRCSMPTCAFWNNYFQPVKLILHVSREKKINRLPMV
jgi:hypothetical protein